MAMRENQYGYGPWEYRYVCKSCGYAVRAPKNTAPCSVCGGDFAKEKTSMRKLYLEAEKPPIVEKEEVLLGKSWFENLLALFGIHTAPRYAIREIKKVPSRRWRWQTHAEVEEESGIMRHEDFL